MTFRRAKQSVLFFSGALLFLCIVPSTGAFFLPHSKAARLGTSFSQASSYPLQQRDDHRYSGRRKKTTVKRHSNSHPSQRNYATEVTRFNQWLIKHLREDGGSVKEAESELLQRVQKHREIFETEKRAGPRDFDTFSFNLIMNAWGQQRSMNAAKNADNLLQILLQQTPVLKPDSYSYSAVLNAYAKCRGKTVAAKRAEELLNQMENTIQVTTDICHNAVINCWSVSGHPDAGRRAQRWLTRLEESKDTPKPTKISYNNCIKAWARSPNGASNAHQLLQKMQDLGGQFSPDKISYSTCIDAYCKCTDDLSAAAVKAEQLLTQMEEKAPMNEDIRPDVVAYTSVLYAFAKAGTHTNEAMQLIDRMKKHANEQPNTTFLNTLLHLFAKSHKIEPAETLLRSMKQNDMADRISYTAVISANANVGNAKRAKELLSEIWSQYESSEGNARFLPTTKTYASVLHAIAKSKDRTSIDLNEVDNLLDQLRTLHQETGSPELQPNTVLYSLIFLILSNSRDPSAPERAEKLMALMKEEQGGGNENVRPDATTYAYLINTYTKSRVHNSAQMARKLLEEVEAGFEKGYDELRPTKLLYSAVLQAHAKSASREGAECAEALLQRTKDLYRQGKLYAKPTTLYYNAVIDAHSRSKRGRDAAKRAEELLDELEQRHRAGDSELAPTTRSYNAVILAWKNSNSEMAPRRAEALLKRMNERYSSGDQTCRPDRVTINTIIGVWAKSRAPDAAERAETFLKFMENLYLTVGDSTFKPDSYSYNTVIDAYSSSSLPTATDRAEGLYTRMMERYQAGDSELKPGIITLTALRRAWAQSDSSEAHERIRHLSQDIEKKQKHHTANKRKAARPK
ncbi:unnamed protein product [Cylindrotheca closterium]|uniref:Pentacotripeptide-repeat region of PRORP domain-containing protein n=1 Tax=Cylindrotheca closterium TaxID=2856 RepID=A0AAD2GBR0_9STRA|nr:unnamed protein product [Cylindrotheca closterium]